MSWYQRCMRLFTALVPPEDAREDLDGFLAPRREAAQFRWTSPEAWHVTLAFMPHVAQRHLDDLLERLGRATAKRTAHPLVVSGGGAFPDPARAHVLYAAVDGTPDAVEELRRLATGARAAATRSGAGAEGGRFRAHLTLARLGRPEEVSSWVRLLEAYRGPAWPMTEVALVQSHLGEGPRRRPRYEVLATWEVGRRG